MKPVVLIIMDGYAIGKEYEGNAVYLAKKPNLDKLIAKYPNTMLKTSGLDVGLPDKQMGNSEVGHLNIGAGRIVYQSLTRVNLAIENGEFFENQTFIKAIRAAKINNKKLHLMGLFSKGGVHSHMNHFEALVKLAKKEDIKCYIHAFTDGRDVLPHTSIEDFKEFEQTLQKLQHGTIATVMGRFYAMDRDNIWERTKKAYDLIVHGEGEKFSSVTEAISSSYDNDVTDEFIKPALIDEQGLVSNGDAVIFVNFRPDRAIQLSTALTNIEKAGFTDEQLDLHFVQMMHYSEKVKGNIAFNLQQLKNLYGDIISANNMNQLRIAETQKYAHVTFFFDGGKDREIKGSTRILIDSPKIESFDELPEMSAYKVTETVISELKTNKYHTVILNYANCDMVGHTGNVQAAMKAVEVVDECVGKVVNTILQLGGVALITADHGNADHMIDESGSSFTAHTTNPVPMIITKENLSLRKGNLGDIAPTMLQLLELDQPEEMTGISLIKK